MASREEFVAKWTPVAYMWCNGTKSEDRASKPIEEKMHRAHALVEEMRVDGGAKHELFARAVNDEKHFFATFAAKTNVGMQPVRARVVFRRARSTFHGHETVPVHCSCDCSEACFFPITMAWDPHVRARDSDGGSRRRAHSACPFPCYHTLALAEARSCCSFVLAARRAPPPGCACGEATCEFRWMDVGDRLRAFHAADAVAASRAPRDVRPNREREDLEDIDLPADAVKWGLSHLQQNPRRLNAKSLWTFGGIHCDSFEGFPSTPDGEELLRPVRECASFEGFKVFLYRTRYTHNMGKARHGHVVAVWLAAVLPDGTHTEAAVVKYDWQHFECPVWWSCSCAEARDKPLADYEAALGATPNRPAPTPVPCKHVAGIIQYRGDVVHCVRPFCDGFPNNRHKFV